MRELVAHYHVNHGHGVIKEVSLWKDEGGLYIEMERTPDDAVIALTLSEGAICDFASAFESYRVQNRIRKKLNITERTGD